MHRSGTSAFAGSLAKAGLFAGKSFDLLPAANDNPHGFFERFDVTDFNNELLAELGGAWDNPPSRLAVIEHAPLWQDRAEEILETMAKEADGRPLVIKDPRMCLLLPVWLTAFGDRFTLVLVDRNPLEVAASMHQREGRPLHVGLALWQLYCAELLEGLAGKKVWFARYESLLLSPTQHTSALLDELKGSLAVGADGTRAVGGINGVSDAAAFVVGELRHQRIESTGADLEQALTEDQFALRRWLCQLPEGWVTLDAPSNFCSQPKEALAFAVERDARLGKPAPAPTLRGALRLARHHYHEGGLIQVTKRGASEVLRLACKR